MAITEDEKRTARAYNIGYMLSTYEPRLLDNIIKRNPDNEFVKSMKVGRDHHEFHANIPRKDYTPEFKNGFYNGRALTQHEPVMLERLLMNPAGLSKKYVQGLKSAQKEYGVKEINKKINEVPKAPAPDLRSDTTFQKGFNVGYRLTEKYSSALRHSEVANEKYSKFIEGVAAGKKQYDFDLSELREKDPNGRMFPNDPQNSNYQSAVIEDKLYAINDISNDQLRVIERQKGFDDVPLPNWLQKKAPDKDKNGPKKDKNKGFDLDR